ncbi:ureidoglycolate lyase [Epibacterium sp. Ofav1-8]|uniref:ureidoglycolate lyase n=1 Tax=Epibacterium sp. Ofav1-8 TaxID=2917735 RepID=UPI001EF4ABFC|nr:ureidoglycolate lyase [Epibacterium sp. Ofav1-8]MCG7623539.1 ureidoglycolate lyase [Epibacterium sp. Ofav1-8]
MTRELRARPLTAAAFAAFGDVLEPKPEADKIINQGKCGRHHDLALLDFGDGRAGISLFDAEARHLPYRVELVERHPSGSQAFVPLDGVPMIVIVAPDAGGAPGTPQAFLSQPGQSINLHRGVWHGVLAPFEAPGKYIVVDRIGDGANLEEHWFDDPWIVTEVLSHAEG